MRRIGLSLVLLTLIGNLNAITLYPDGSGDYPTIQQAVDAAQNNDTIILMPGIYSGNGNRDITDTDNDLTLQGSGEVTIDCGNSEQEPHNGINLNYSTWVIEGINFTNAEKAIVAEACSVNNCEFLNNNTGIYSDYGDIQINNCVFKHNSRALNFSGSDDVIVTNCKISGFSGTGIYSYNTRNLQILDTEIRDCHRCVLDISLGTCKLLNCIIADNKTQLITDGIIDISDANLDIINCAIVNNSAVTDGSILKYSAYDNNSIRFINTFLIDNGNESAKSIIVNEYSLSDTDSYNLNITNCIYDTSLSIECDSQYLSTSSNFTYDNDFIFDSLFRPSPSSTAIDAGIVPSGVALPQFDIMGNPRIDGLQIDIGPYEFSDEVLYLASDKEELIFHLNGNDNPQYMDVFYHDPMALPSSLASTVASDSSGLLNISQSTNFADKTRFSIIPNVDSLVHGTYNISLAITFSSLHKDRHEEIEKIIPCTIYVNKQLNIPQDYLDMSTAIEEAISGDTIIVADGVYTGLNNAISNLAGKELTIKSQSGNPENCVFDFESDKTGINILSYATESVSIDGITFQNGVVDDYAFVILTGETILHNCRFRNTIATLPVPYGVRYVQPLGINEGLIENCIFDGISGAVFYGNSLIKNCVFTNMSAPPIIAGCSQIEYSDFYDNNCVVLSTASSAVRLDFCNFTGNNQFKNPIKDPMTPGTCIALGVNTKAEINNCLFSGNLFEDMILYANFEKNVTLNNCTFSGNCVERADSGLVFNGTNMQVSNCIFYNNDAANGYDITLSDSRDATLAVNYSNVGLIGTYNSPESEINIGIGNIDVDPLFVNEGYWEYEQIEDLASYTWHKGDYHLKTNSWRWDTTVDYWVFDSETSRCIDAGCPSSLLENEPLYSDVDSEGDWAENIRINMGCYGGTTTASIPPLNWYNIADIDNDGIVNNKDIVVMAAEWLKSDELFDVSRDGDIGSDDLLIVADNWLQISTWKFPPW